MPSDHVFAVQLVCSLLLLTDSYGASVPVNARPKLLVISLDGFRHDYLELSKFAGINISAFERIWRTGFRAMRVYNEFITRTAPNHFSIATGLHEESHGLVDNAFYDPRLNATFSLSDVAQSKESRWFDVGAEPIWVTNQRHGHRSAINLWPGINAKIKGQSASDVYPDFNISIPFQESITWVIKKLQQPNVTLGMIYHHEPDQQGHKFGPFSQEVLSEIGSINLDLNYLLRKVNENPSLRTQLNIILTSDHGMMAVNRQRLIVLSELITDSMFISPGPSVRVVWALWPKSGFTAQDLYNRLAEKHHKMRVYLREDIPKHLHYKTSWRIAPVVAFADPGWMIAETKEAAASFTRAGDHGYTTDWPDMSPFFLASGPGFRPQTGNKTIPFIHMVDIYPMMCHLLGLNNPAPTNGSLDRVLTLLQSPNILFHNALDQFSVIAVCLLVVVLAVVFVASSCLACRCLDKNSIRLMRRRRMRKQQQQRQSISQSQGHASNGPLNKPIRLHSLRSSSANASDGTAHLLPHGSQFLEGDNDDDDEVDLLVTTKSGNQRSELQDDTAWINMLHGPKSRYP